MECPNERTARFVYENNYYVHSVEREYLRYCFHTDTDVFNITVTFRDGQRVSWTSNIISRYGNGLFVDSEGKFIFGCSMRGIYCCHLKTGEKIWQKRKMAKYMVMNDDNTVTCEWHKHLFIVDVNGYIIKELKTNYEASLFHIENNSFLIRSSKAFWIIVSSQLDKQYEIPDSLFLSRIKSAMICNDTLTVRYWSRNDGDFDRADEQVINLLPYKNESL